MKVEYDGHDLTPGLVMYEQLDKDVKTSRKPLARKSVYAKHQNEAFRGDFSTIQTRSYKYLPLVILNGVWQAVCSLALILVVLTVIGLLIGTLFIGLLYLWVHFSL